MAVIISDGISPPCTKGIISIPKANSTAIKRWEGILKEDLNNAGQIEDFRIDDFRSIKIFQNMSQEERNTVASFIRTNYSLHDDYPLIYPRFSLFEERDALGPKPPKNHTPRHLLVLLHSITGERKSKPKVACIASLDPKVPHGDEHAKRDEHLRICIGISSSSSEKIVYQKENIATIGEGSQKITFILPEGKKVDENKLKEIYNLVTELNMLIRSKPVKRVIMTNGLGEYDEILHRIIIPIDDYCPETVVHEMGHAIYRVLLQGETRRIPKDEFLRMIYYFSLGSKKYEIVDDSNYVLSYSSEEPDGRGHPGDQISELIASALMVYMLHPDDLIQNILDPDTPEATRKLGKLIWCYLRDKVFIREGDTKGMVFSKTDPFEHESVESIGLKNEEIVASLINALDDRTIGEIGSSAIMGIGRCGIQNKKFIKALLKAIRSNNYIERGYAAEAIGNLGIRDDRLIAALLEALDEECDFVSKYAAKALGKIAKKSNKKVIMALKKLAKNDDLKEVAQNALMEIKKHKPEKTESSSS